MIEYDQPKIFGDSIVAALSSVDDGDMKFGVTDVETVASNRQQFLGGLQIDSTQTTLLNVSYEDNTNFTRYVVLDDDQQGTGVLSPDDNLHADAAVVTRPGHAVILPLADCVGAILYDPAEQILMVSHLGRHSLEQRGAAKSVRYMVDQFGIDPANLLVWFGPAASAESYPLEAFEGLGLAEVASEQLISEGINPANIELSPIDTTASLDYYSHSEYLAGERDYDGRFAIVAMMVE